MNDFDKSVLSLVVFLPVAGAIVLALVPKAQERLIKLIALGTTLITAGLSTLR